MLHGYDAGGHRRLHAAALRSAGDALIDEIELGKDRDYYDTLSDDQKVAFEPPVVIAGHHEPHRDTESFGTRDWRKRTGSGTSSRGGRFNIRNLLARHPPLP